MNFLDVMSSIGPLQLAVKRMLSDVAKLLVLLVIILLGKEIVLTLLQPAWCLMMNSYSEISSVLNHFDIKNTMIKQSKESQNSHCNFQP